MIPSFGFSFFSLFARPLLLLGLLFFFSASSSSSSNYFILRMMTKTSFLIFITMVCREAVHLSFEGPTAAADNDSIVFPDARKRERRREKKERTRRRTRRRRRRRWRRRRRRWKRVFFCFSLDLVPSLPLSLRRRSPPPQPSSLTLAQKKNSLTQQERHLFSLD